MDGALPKRILTKIRNNEPINKNHKIVKIHRNGKVIDTQVTKMDIEEQRSFDGPKYKNHQYVSGNIKNRKVIDEIENIWI